MTGFSTSALAAADEVLRCGHAERLWPGIVAAVGVGPSLEREWVLGWAEDWPGGRRDMTVDTVFDLASLTKVLATLPSVLLLVERGALGLDAVVADYVPGVDARVRVRDLLTHSSGLPAQLGRGRHGERAMSPAALAAAAAATSLEEPPGVRVMYSDVGFVLLGAIVEAVTGVGLGGFAEREVLEPLSSSATFAPPADWRPRIAATEVVDGRPVHGRVHDESAAAAGGPVGHAGLFGALTDVRACLPLWEPGGPLLGDDLRAEALRDATAALGGHRGLGWTCRGDVHDILSPGWGARAVSHTGFTGTSIAFDPATRRWAILLTNAVHYGRGRPEVFVRRRRFHAALVGD
jgi:CubicO group peptidase (beta-lactamase class C family)